MTTAPRSARLGADHPDLDREAVIREFLFPRSFRHAILGLLLAVGLPIGAITLSRSFDLALPSALMLFAVVVATAVGRMGAGIVAAVLGGALLSHYYLEPTGSLFPGRWEAIAGILIFLLAALVTSALLSRARSAYDVAEAARRETAEARRAEEASRRRLDAISAASRALAVSFDIEENLARAAQLGIRYLGDSAMIYVPDGRGGLEVVASAAREGAAPRADPEAASGGGHVGRSLRTARPQFRPIVERTPSGEPVTAERELALPLTIGRRSLGVLVVSRIHDASPFSDDDVAFAEELARRMARALENARLYHERDQIATVLQHSLLPGALPEIPGLDLAAHYEAAGDAYEVGGDFYDLVDLGPSSWLVVVGDVCGKGPEAAAVMGFARASIRAAAQKDDDPCAILTTLNQALISRGWSRFVTVACVRLDEDGGAFRARSAVGGHPRPVLVRAEGRPDTVGEYGTVLGVFPDVDLVAADVRLGPGDAIVLYTDGLEGIERSAEDVVVRCTATLHPGGSARSIVRALETVRIGSPRAAADDLAVLAVSVPIG